MLLTTLIHDSLSILQETGGVTIDINGNCIAKPQNYWMFPKYPSKTLIIPITTDINREVLAYIEKIEHSSMSRIVFLVFGLILKPMSIIWTLQRLEKVKNRHWMTQDSTALSREEISWRYTIL